MYCANPPQPNTTEHHLELTNWEWGQIYAFGEVAVYECEDGYFFDQDKDQLNFTLTCMEDGNWTDHKPWHWCDFPASKTLNLSIVSLYAPRIIL